MKFNFESLSEVRFLHDEYFYKTTMEDILVKEFFSEEELHKIFMAANGSQLSNGFDRPRGCFFFSSGSIIYCVSDAGKKKLSTIKESRYFKEEDGKTTCVTIPKIILEFARYANHAMRRAIADLLREVELEPKTLLYFEPKIVIKDDLVFSDIYCKIFREVI